VQLGTVRAVVRFWKIRWMCPELESTRRMLRGLVLPGQRRLHMKDESDSRKRSIATAIADSGITATIYDAAVATTPSGNDEPPA